MTLHILFLSHQSMSPYLQIATEYGPVITSFFAFFTALAALLTAKASSKNVRILNLNSRRNILLKKQEYFKEKMDRLVTRLIANEELIRTYFVVETPPKPEETDAHRYLSQEIKSNLYLGSTDLRKKADRYFNSLHTYYKYYTGEWRIRSDSQNFLKDLAKTFQDAKEEFSSAILTENSELEGKIADISAQIDEVDKEIKSEAEAKNWWRSWK